MRFLPLFRDVHARMGPQATSPGLISELWMFRPAAIDTGRPIDRVQRPSTWMNGMTMLTVWWPVLAFVCLSIHARIEAKYFRGLLTASGIQGDPSFADILFLYRQDLAIFGVIMPLLTAWCFLRLRFAIAATLALALVFLVQVLLYANLQSWGQVGSFLTLQAFKNAMSFAASNPEFVGEYISLRGLLKLAVLLALSGTILLAGHLLFYRRWLVRTWGTAALISTLGFAVLSIIGYSSAMRPAPISASFVLNATLALADQSEATGTSPQASELDARYQQLANIHQTAFRGPNFAVHKGSNVLLFIMETASIEFLDVRRGMPALAPLDAFRGKTYVGANHFTTFPASAESNLSILTGTYPPRAIYGTCLIDVPRDGGRLPGPIVQLRDVGYKTGIYAPYRSQVPADKVVFEGTGFENVIYGDSLPGPEIPDKRALNRLTSDIQRWIAARQPFAAAFLPQIGHGPWPSELGTTVRDRGAKIAREQLGWLDQIVRVLRAEGQLDNTIIIVTGDHGVRTLAEDPRVKAGMIDWYSFHVPLLLFAPHADYSDLDPRLPSSHVDLSAELGELLGLPSLPSYQGLPLHHPERATRRQFLMAGWYFGANGYRDWTEAAMYSNLLDAVYARPDAKVEFGSAELVTDERRTAIKGRLLSMASLQEGWVANRTCQAGGKPDHTAYRR